MKMKKRIFEVRRTEMRETAVSKDTYIFELENETWVFVSPAHSKHNLEQLKEVMDKLKELGDESK